MLIKLKSLLVLVTLLPRTTKGKNGKLHLVKTVGNTMVNSIKVPKTNSTNRKIRIKTEVSKDYFDEEIIGGKIATVHEFPWMVRIERGCAIGTCGGALISPRLVLTAFHCTIDPLIRVYKPCDHSDEKRVAVLGNPNIEDNSTRVEIPITNVFYPPGAGLLEDLRNTTDHDFAMVVLKRPVTFSEYIQPICLPEQGQKFSGEDVVTAGWGHFKENSIRRSKDLSPVLRKVTLRVSSKLYEHKKIFGTELRKNADGKYMDPCAGDSGGPLMKMLYDKAIIIGTVVGVGYDCKNNRVSRFEGSTNGVWNQVSVWVDWIRSTMNLLHEEEKAECSSKASNTGFESEQKKVITLKGKKGDVCCSDDQCSKALRCTGRSLEPGLCRSEGSVKFCRKIKPNVDLYCQTSRQSRKKQHRCKSLEHYLQKSCGYLKQNSCPHEDLNEMFELDAFEISW